MNAAIDAIWPERRRDLTDAELLTAYAPPDSPWLRMNFISSLDGAATREGRSGDLGDPPDRRVFELLRRWADVVLLGAGTARAEGYGAMVLPDDAVAWRRERGLRPQPAFALVTRRLDLDPGSAIFTQAPVRPIVYTVSTAPAVRREALAEVADVVDVGGTTADPRAVRSDLESRGHARIHAEGGPTLFGAFIAAGAVDELCLTLAPTLEGGSASRIAHDPEALPTRMSLAGIMASGDELLLRYTRDELTGTA